MEVATAKLIGKRGLDVRELHTYPTRDTQARLASPRPRDPPGIGNGLPILENGPLDACARGQHAEQLRAEATTAHVDRE
jgi:hypothetical protein